ncbi:hypothetical protein JM946_00765 [Steroidobacter sp. S1-65]|uniref:Uncharacterized protein n=1 Tax=Steroidobacter gossypii TaxID=2805490 RepID=A0ABS1WQK5_9GAMM|nr:hypothetical protein [Steroidobacter gossypii]MBM0103248.1 hypothetical protein [Steroidobacter gossypii]
MNTHAASSNTSSPAPTLVAKHDGLKEYVAAVLSIAIVGFTLYFMWGMFGRVHDDAIKEGKWNQQSAILQLAVALAGTVTGYYFGRIPAERAATASQQAAATSNALARQAAAKEARIRDQVRDLRLQIPSANGKESLDANALRNLEVRLEEILRT